MMYYHTFGTPFFMFDGLFHFLFWLLIIILIFKLIRGSKKHHHWMEMWGEKSAMNVLRDRYARGEISKEEYEERKKVLEK